LGSDNAEIIVSPQDKIKVQNKTGDPFEKGRLFISNEEYEGHKS
jgi:hypothetical protein